MNLSLSGIENEEVINDDKLYSEQMSLTLARCN